MLKRKGILGYNQDAHRYEVAYNDGDREELHCGRCFDIMIRNEWKATRIEWKGEWYLVGYPPELLDIGLMVRVTA